MIELYGKAAPIEASERCNKALRDEDMDTYDLWQAITGTISQIMFPAFHDRSYEQPKRQFSEADVWTATRQMMELDPKYPSIGAAQRADALLDEGDMEGSAFWVRVTKALEEMERRVPRDGETVN
jgi:hypothetical protein